MLFKNDNDVAVLDNLIAHALNGIISNDYEGYTQEEMCKLAVVYAATTFELRNKLIMQNQQRINDDRTGKDRA